MFSVSFLTSHGSLYLRCNQIRVRTSQTSFQRLCKLPGSVCVHYEPNRWVDLSTINRVPCQFLTQWDHCLGRRLWRSQAREPPSSQLGRTRGGLWHFTVETCSGCWPHQCGDSLTVDYFKTDVLTSAMQRVFIPSFTPRQWADTSNLNIHFWFTLWKRRPVSSWTVVCV